MKVSGVSAGSEGSTPPMKKLKQARLPFQIITSETGKTQETKKRKLSEEREETPNKIVKKSIAKNFEEDVQVLEKVDDALVISDDEKVEEDEQKEEEISPKPLNPLVSIVDIALKRKLNKKKASPPKKKFKESKMKTRSKKSKRHSEEIEDKEGDNKTKDCGSVKVEESDKKITVIVDNKENINQVILIEDSNDGGEVKHSEDANKIVVATEETVENKQNDTQDKLEKDDITSEIKKKENKCKTLKKGNKIVSSMKDEGIVELSDGDVSEHEQQLQTKDKKQDNDKQMDNVEKVSKKEHVEKNKKQMKNNAKDLKKEPTKKDNKQIKIDENFFKKEHIVKSKQMNNDTEIPTGDLEKEKQMNSDEKVLKEEQIIDDKMSESDKLDASIVSEQQDMDVSLQQNDSDEADSSILDNTSHATSDCDDDSVGDVSDDAKCINNTPDKKSVDKSLTTPKSNKRQSLGDKTTNSPHTPVDIKKLTPKQLQKRMESVKKQQEREKEKQDRLRKKQEEKEERNRQRIEKEEQKKKEREEKEELRRKEKEEKERQKEQERKEREEKEEAKKKEKEEKELQKKREREAKEEERRKKELEKEEDKRKKELEKEEAELKKKKAAAAFVNFFVPKASGSKQNDEVEPMIKHDYLSNFTKKADMRLAPIRRKTLSDDQKCNLDEFLLKQNIEKAKLFVNEIKCKSYEVGCSERTWPLEEEDVMVVEDELPIDSVDFVPEESHKQKMRAKLLSFSENRRPPYWGTWRRKSVQITGRRPFGMDSKILDYECDSDDEWEEEEPGESVGGSVAGSDVEEEDNDYDVDNDFMVPHGYLSEEEAMGEEDEVLSPESQKAKLKIMQCEFEKEMKKNTEKLHPRSIGIIWQKSDGAKPDSCKDSLWDFLVNRRILSEEENITIQPKQIVVDSAPEETKNEKPLKKSRKITEDMTPDLAKLVHGNTNNRGFLAYEYQTYLAKLNKDQNDENAAEMYVNVSKMSIAKKIKEISKWMACPIEGPMFGKMCWCVSKEVLEKYELKIDLPNKWSYVLTPKKRANITQIKQFLNTEQAST